MNRLLFYLSCGITGFLIGNCIGQYANAADPKYKIAVIDSGFSYVPFSMAGMKLCSKGHYDFATNRPVVGIDVMGHGAYVTALIDQHADTNNICYLIYRVFGGGSGYKSVNSALVKAINSGAKAVNMSLGMNVRHYALGKSLRVAKARGIKVFVAAGNSNKDLTKRCDEYPVCFKNTGIEKIGAYDKYNNRAFYSNYGYRVSAWNLGDLGSALGTSFASPRALGDYVKSLKLDKR